MIRRCGVSKMKDNRESKKLKTTGKWKTQVKMLACCFKHKKCPSSKFFAKVDLKIGPFKIHFETYRLKRGKEAFCNQYNREEKC